MGNSVATTHMTCKKQTTMENLKLPDDQRDERYAGSVI